jgi:hypothetical protein
MKKNEVEVKVKVEEMVPFGHFVNAFGETPGVMGISLSENTPARCGRGDLAPTLTNINKPRMSRGH